MKKVLMLAVLASAFSALPALAEDAAKGPGHHGRFFEKMDLDSDGAVTKEEFIKAHEERFSKMDANGDGKITKEEAEAMKKALREQRQENKAETPADSAEAVPDESAPETAPAGAAE